ncbi:RBBP9/YdeN family alpha/beta hydrolase [Leifsonia poae]|uniref:RBBP9/YdeN family alpha/beta hydrolase n=1 Tax=Leifsonia poae TaxID=110933 RepID=UPI001CBB8B6D|nr:alpha/beta hydrolase [Leifsonia poae]
MTRSFLILHGWDNFRPPGHWQHELATALRSRGERVVYPQLPDAARPSVDAWRDAAGAALAEASGNEAHVVVLCHSLACLLWLGTETLSGDESVERVLLVAPPSPEVVAGFPAIAAFARLPLIAGATPTLIAASDDDPFCPAGATAVFGAPFGLPVTVVPGGGHLERTAGYGAWPAVEAWCLDPATPIVPR